jgi:hypothetical protein
VKVAAQEVSGRARRLDGDLEMRREGFHVAHLTGELRYRLHHQVILTVSDFWRERR